jgi:hypothetical protein
MITATEWANPVSMLPFGVFRLRMQQVSARQQRELGRRQLRGDVTHRAYHGQLSYQRQ